MKRFSAGTAAILGSLPTIWLLLLLSQGLLTAAMATPNRERTEANRIRQGTTLPLSFEPNLGQTDSRAKYIARGDGYTLFLTSTEAVLRLRPTIPRSPAKLGLQKEDDSTVLRVKLVGANPTPVITALDELPGKSNYLKGDDPEGWHSNVPHYSRVRYRNVRPGVDLLYYHGNPGQLEYDLIVSPGSDPEDLVLEFEGASDMQMDSHGRLRLDTPAGRVWQEKPLAYQSVDGTKRAISSRYVLKGKNRIGFALGDYDRNRAVVIDPILGYSTYLGGSDSLTPQLTPRLAFTRAVAIATDSAGNTYVAGTTDAIDFPSTNGRTINFTDGGCFAESEVSEPCDNFVTKFSPSGALVYSTFLGSTFVLPKTTALAVDRKGQAYIAGWGAFFAEVAPSFVKKLNASGSAVLYEYKGFFIRCYINAIAVDSAENVYVAGFSDSPEQCPATPGVFQPNPSGESGVAFLAKLDSTLSGVFSGTETLTYLTFLGLGNARSVAVDGDGNAYVAGFTNVSGFPTTSTFGSGVGGAFVMKVNPTASKLIFSALLHGADATSIALDPSRNVYVTGSALATGFPRTAGAFRSTFAGGSSDAFVSKLSPGGLRLLYSTYLGGSNDDHGTGIAVDGSGRAYVGGYTRSSNFPVTSNAVQKTFGGGTCSTRPCADAFVTTLNASGTGISFYSTFVGGSASDFANGLGLDRALNVYIAGETFSGNFPVSSGAFQTNRQGLSDAFVSKLVIAADLEITKTGVGSVARGSNLTYTIKALNKGPDTSDLPVLTDAIPSGTTFVSAAISSGSCTTPAVGGTGSVTCRRTRMTKGAPWTLTLAVKVQAASGSKIVNTARITAKTQDLVNANNSASVSTVVQ